MRVHDIEGPDGRTAVVRAPDSIPAEKVLEWAQGQWAGWADGGTYDMPAPADAVQNENGSMSTERLITVEMDGKHYLLPTIVDGEPIPEEEAVQRFRDQRLRPIGVFDSDEEATTFAKVRSAAGGKMSGMEPPESNRYKLRPMEAQAELLEIDQTLAAIRELRKKWVQENPELSGAASDPEQAFEDWAGIPGLAEQDRKLRERKDALSVGSTGEVIGGMAGGVAGAATGAALAAPIPIPGARVVGAGIGAILGAAGGAGLGTHLKDIPDAREAREISEADAAQLIRNRMIESVLYDGAFMLLFGPGGKVIGKVIKAKGKLGQALKEVAKETVDWQNAVDMARRTARSSKLGGKAPRSLMAQISDRLGVQVDDAERASRAAKLVDDLGGEHLPTKGQMSGKVTKGELFLRRQAPEYFDDAAVEIADKAKAIKEQALSGLEPALRERDLGRAIQHVRESAEEAVKAETRPTWEKARQLGIRFKSKPLLDNINGALKRAAESNYAGFSNEEVAFLRRFQDFFTKNPQMSSGGMRDLISGFKDDIRNMSKEGVPSQKFEAVMNELTNLADGIFTAGVKQLDPQFATELLRAKDLYRDTFKDLYSDTMIRVARSTTPQKLGYQIAATGNSSEIAKLRQAMMRAEAGAPSASRVRPGRSTVLSQKEVAKMRREIDAGLIQGFLEKNTSNMEDLAERMANPQFRDTLRELLLGPLAADHNMNARVLKMLDEMAAAVKVGRPEFAPEPGKLGIPGMGGIGLGTAAGAATGGNIQGAVATAFATVFGVRFVSSVIAKAMTTRNLGMVNRLRRVMALGKHASTTVAAGEAFVAAFNELRAEMNDQQAEVPEQEPAE